MIYLAYIESRDDCNVHVTEFLLACSLSLNALESPYGVIQYTPFEPAFVGRRVLNLPYQVIHIHDLKEPVAPHWSRLKDIEQRKEVA